MGDQRWVVVTREISKKFESKVRGAVLDVISHFENHPPKGEFVIIIQADE